VAFKRMTSLPYQVSGLLLQLIYMFYIFGSDRKLIKINEGNHVGDTFLTTLCFICEWLWLLIICIRCMQH